MNFFGHAVLADRQRRDSGFVLGAMLPDFIAMSGAAAERVHRDDIAAGVAFHHRTDAVFHAAAAFRAQVARGSRALAARGVRRGGAMGASHVGIELLLDGALTGDPRARDAYRGALAVDVRGAIAWGRDDDEPALLALLDRLAAHDVPDDYRDPDIVARRVERALSRRPRLALNPDEVARVRDWLAEVRSAVTQAAPRLVADVWSELAASSAKASSSDTD